jgi:hypothetical protein
MKRIRMGTALTNAKAGEEVMVKLDDSGLDLILKHVKGHMSEKELLKKVNKYLKSIKTINK